MSVSSFQCTSCGSGDIQRLAIVYESGTSNIETTTHGSTTGVGIGSGGRLGVGTAASSHRTSGTQMTELAKRAAPPEQKTGLGWIAIGLIAAVVLAVIISWIVAVPVLAGFVFLARQGMQYNSNVWPGLKSTWDRSWLCHRCGATFVPSSAAQAVQPDNDLRLIA